VQKKTLYLIRHGETTSNREDRVQGWSEPLTPLGRAQARKLGERLAATRDLNPIKVIYTSRMVRAKMTAMGVAEKLNPGCDTSNPWDLPVPIIASEHLHERLHPSYIHGLLTSDPVAKSALENMRNNFHNPSFDYADGETYNQLIDRADRALDEIFADPNEHIAIVSHGVFLSAFVNRALHGAHMSSHVLRRSSLHFSNAGIAIMKHEHGRVFDGEAWRWAINVSDNSHTLEIE
jgi:broad specificity phosphatase PhoE